MKQSGRLYLFIIFLFIFLPFMLRAQQVNFTKSVAMHTRTSANLYAYNTKSTGTELTVYQWNLINATNKKTNNKKAKTGLLIAQVAVGALAVALAYPEIKELGRLKQVQKYGPYWDIQNDIFRQAVRTNIFIGVGVGVSVPLALIRRKF